MTGPDRIWAERKTMPGDPAENGYWESRDLYALTMAEYIRRDPAVLAALPEVQALIAAAYDVAAQTVATQGDSSATEALGQRICCSGHMCGCQGATVEEWLLHLIRALAPADATAALARIVREAEARGMERAADRARVYASNYEQSSDGRNTFILLAEWADAEAAAILARAEQIEREAK